ncbi:MAG: hypothetical protein GXO90_04780, partial [FCB group bacterium]|nr:hypothetical protein [FCB group bacterium]
MKSFRNTTLLSCTLLFGVLYAESILTPAAPAATQLRIIEQGNNESQLTLVTGQLRISNRTLGGMTYTQLTLPGGYHTQTVGAPQLPAFHRLLVLPEMEQATVRMTAVRWKRLDLKSLGYDEPLTPFQPSIPKNIDPATVPVVLDSTLYSRSEFWGDSLAILEPLGHFRNQALYRLRINPVRWNPVTGELEIAEEISVTIDYQDADWGATETLARNLSSPLFQLPSSFAVNLTNANSNRENLISDPPKIVVICPSDFLSALDSWVDWKERQGYTVVIGVPGQDGLGTTAAEIRTWISSLYASGNSTDPAPSFVMIVGDNGDVPGFNGTTGAHRSDLYYAEATGDFLPDMYVGRLSGNSLQQIQDIVDKTVLYEQQALADPSYQLEVTMIGGVDSDYGSSHANGQINYGVNTYFNPAHDILSHTYLYPSSGSAESSILSDMNSGIGYINYTAHGSETSWADPTVTISNVHSLANSQKYFLAVANACLTAKYDFGECIGEAFLRQPDGGAIGYIGGSNNTYWDEDYYWAVGYGPIVGDGPDYSVTGLGIYDGMFHDHGEEYATWCTVNGAITVRGNLAVAESGSANENYYWEIYTLLGDPTLSTNLGQPSPHPATYPNVLLAGSPEMTIEGDPWSLVSLNIEGTHVLTGRISGGGVLTLPLSDLNLTPGQVELVITAQNRIPVIDTLQVIAPETPYLLATNPVIIDSSSWNPNNQFDFGESILLSFTVQNVGLLAAQGISITLTSTDWFATVEPRSFALDHLTPDSTTVVDSFTVSLSGGCPDGRQIQLEAILSDSSGNTWTSPLRLLAHAPNLTSESIAVEDGNNGRLDINEIADIDLNFSNTGSCFSPDGNAQLTSLDPYVAIITPETGLTSIPVDSTGAAVFSIRVLPTTPPGHEFRFQWTITGEHGYS